ncbi:MAG: O-antigen ligase family protein [Nevskiales bacterium]
MSPANRRPPSAAENLLFWALLLLIVWLPLPLGSNRPWSAALLAAAAGLLLAVYCTLQIAGRTNRAVHLKELSLPIALWLAWLSWCALQLLPLPFATVAAWSPSAAELYRLAFPAEAARLQWPLSIAPELGRRRLLLSLGFFALYLLVAGLTRDRQRMLLLAHVLVISGLFQALYGGFMVLSGLEYGFFEPKTAYRGFATGTFVNRNHLAGYLELCSAVAVGLILADLRVGKSDGWKDMLRNFTAFLFSSKLRVRVFLAAMVIALILTRSRGGNLAFFFSVTACGFLYVLFRERKFVLRSLLLFGSLLLVDIYIVGEWYGLEKLVTRIEQTELSTDVRVQIFQTYPPVIERYWRTGSGLGSFAQAYAPYQPEALEGYWDHAHNDYAQFLIEAGLPGCLILLALVLSTAVHAARVVLMRDNRLRVGICFAVLMAMLAIAIHSVSDFNLQIPANAATLVILMAMAAACSAQSRHRRGARVRKKGVRQEDDAYPVPVT